MLYYPPMQRKTGVIIFTHGSRLAEGNDIMLRLVDQLRAKLGYPLVEACFMELGQPDIYTAVERLLAQGCNHIFGYAFFLVPGKHLQHDIPGIIRCALHRRPDVTWEITEPMMDDPALLDLVQKRIERALATPAK